MADHDKHTDGSEYRSGSFTLTGSIAMGTGVVIGAGIFALTGQVAELAGGLFPLAFIAAAVVVAFSAYSYVKVCNKCPPAAGVAMILKKACGPGVLTAGCSMRMNFSMGINESLVARTFGAYTMRIHGVGSEPWLVPSLGAGLVAFAVNLISNKVMGGLSKVTAIIKLVGITAFAVIGLWVSGLSFDCLVGDGSASKTEGGIGGFLAAVAMSILAQKELLTVANSGGEITAPKAASVHSQRAERVNDCCPAAARAKFLSTSDRAHAIRRTA